MGTIVRKIKKGKPYYYAVESKRVDGKPRIVWQKYLGTLDTIIQKCASSPKPEQGYEVDIFEAGGIAAMLQIARKLRLIEIINENTPKRKQGVSIGEYIVLAAINRVVAPCSKLQMPDWYQKTVLYRLWKYSPDAFSSQAFWNNMDLISEESLDIMQEQIVIQLKQVFGIDPTMLLYDTTNFFTYVATGNHRNTIAKRGRNKQKRDDLRQVGLALLVSKDFQIPLFHKTYPGNIPDRGLFPTVSQELIAWKKKVLKSHQETTLIFDKGNVSDDGMSNLIASNQKFVCGVPRTTDPEFFATKVDELLPVSGLAGTKAKSILIEIWNTKLKAVLAYSERYFSSEFVELTESIRKCQQQLQDLDKWLENGPKRESDKKYYSLESVRSKVNSIRSTSYLKRVMKVDILTEKEIPRLEYAIDQKEIDVISQTCLGRTLLFSSYLEWSENEIIDAYRSQQNIEDAFKLMKNREYLHWHPAFHWTDQKIKVHSFYTVLALLLATLAHRTAVTSGVDVTLLQLLDDLNDIREVALIYPNDLSKNPKHKDGLALSRMSPKQKKLSEALELQQILKI